MPDIVANLSRKITDFCQRYDEEANYEQIAESINKDDYLPIIWCLIPFVVDVGSNQDEVSREAYNLIRELRWVREELCG